MKRLAQIGIAIGFGVLILEVYLFFKLHYVFELSGMQMFTLLIPLGALYLWLFERNRKNEK